MIDNPLWLKERFTKGQAWVDMLLLANHKENSFLVRGNEVIVKRGQLGWSVVKLAKRWGWSRWKTETFFLMLQKRQQIVQQKSTVTTTITIVNYDSYQLGLDGVECEKRQQKRQQNQQQKPLKKGTNKNVLISKNDINKKKRRVKKPFSPPTLEEVSSYIKEKELNVDGDFFFKFFTEGDWYDSKGNKVSSWKQKLLTWNNHKDNKVDVNIGKGVDYAEQTRAAMAAMKPKQETESDDDPF